jgi:hypothetical protein
VGAALARGEGLEVLYHLLDRVEAFSADPNAPAPQFLGHMPRSHRPLNVVVSQRQMLTSI